MSRHKDAVGPKAILRRIGVALISARARAIMSIGIVLGLGAVGTLAAWSDTATATSGVFTTGRLDIKVGTPAVDNDPPLFATTLANPAIFPGDTVSAGLLVTNAEGSVANTFTIGVRASNPTLGSLLSTAVHSGAPANGVCSGTPLGSVIGLVTPVGAPTNSPKPIPGVNLPLAVTGMPGSTQQLCISVTMLPTATQPATAISSTITYTITATSS
ncbi:hypothetical protein CH251_16655 [Rhodococcus sp. 06-462-5]|uniref:SipW-dependent-type signal peptide-containing protein n=1 Tax=unclassified Rhodococcus (in: high G+C Gram-positive bacteria) TaxID=192944 RepID=UPI000B9C1A88|nr:MULTISPECIES: SipW-dependent-type signal peptide-containing protein [unclassified Rhodococcus (in: high G+C Gram-positive bacteria)]OZC71100.1 hypothetical protein CH251_16655 [Rhodococcus sp. 06-462-5]OZE58558.1 hypothetical protein CH270_25395 [Rhodococcus sp. 02-925g]